MIILLTRGESYKENFTSSTYSIYTCYSVGEIAFTFTTRKLGQTVGVVGVASCAVGRLGNELW
jgi:hypothetical protein